MRIKKVREEEYGTSVANLANRSAYFLFLFLSRIPTYFLCKSEHAELIILHNPSIILSTGEAARQFKYSDR